jgi:hypothetical protein
MTQPTRGGIQDSTMFGDIEVIDSNGQHKRLLFSGPAPYVLYVCSPACSWCKMNAVNFRVLAKSLAGRYRILVLSPAIGKPVDMEGSFESYTLVNSKDISRYRLEVTPQTALLDPNGRVTKVWVGAYDAARQAEIESTLGITLPGLDQIGDTTQ